MKIKTVTKSLSIVLLSVILSGTGVQAQSIHSQEKKQKKSALILNEKLQDFKVRNISKFKAAVDNDISKYIEQYYEEENWNDSFQSIYEYSSDRLTITQKFAYWDGENWIQEEESSITFSSEGYPLRLTYDDEGFYESEQIFHYSETGRLDSLTYEEVYLEEYYSEKVELQYITDDSIRIKNIFMEDGELVELESSYLSNRDGNFIEAYEHEEYIDRYTYYGISFDDYLLNVFDEFFFAEVYNDELYPESAEWVSYARITLTEEAGVVTEILEAYYDEGEWWNESLIAITYDEGTITEMIESFYAEDAWFLDYRTLFYYGPSVSTEASPDNISDFKLSQNYPNPFNPATQIKYSIPNSGQVLIEVYNVLGKKVATLVNTPQNAGEYITSFNAQNLPSGIYYYKLMSSDFVEVRAMTLIK